MLPKTATKRGKCRYRTAAAQIRELRSAGVNIPKLPKAYCAIHKIKDTLDRVDLPYLTGNDYLRVNYTLQESFYIK